MSVVLLPKPAPKKLDVELPDELLIVFNEYVKDSMKTAGYPENLTSDARNQVAAIAIARLIANDSVYGENHKENAATARKYNSKPKAKPKTA